MMIFHQFCSILLLWSMILLNEKNVTSFVIVDHPSTSLLFLRNIDSSNRRQQNHHYDNHKTTIPQSYESNNKITTALFLTRCRDDGGWIRRQYRQQRPRLSTRIFRKQTTSETSLYLMTSKSINGPSVINNQQQQHVGSLNNNNVEDDIPIPFLVERLTSRPNPNVFKEISNMCITAFFNDDGTDEKSAKSGMPSFVKEYQLGSLRRMQMIDLIQRKQRQKENNVMFVAYEVIPISTATTKITNKTPLLLNLDNVFNVNSLYNNKKYPSNKSKNIENNQKISPSNGNYNNFNGNTNKWDEFFSSNEPNDYIRGDVLGFVEVTLRPYGLGDSTKKNSNKNTLDMDDPSGTIGVRQKVSYYGQKMKNIKKRSSNDNTNIDKTTTVLRPVLTNLSVKRSARKSGVGTALLKECEMYVVRDWDLNEIVLEVESDNARALQFYKKRHYNILYEDPSSRRYDVNGMWLQEVPCSRYILRKSFSTLSTLSSSCPNTNPNLVEEVQSTFNKGIEAFKRFVRSNSFNNTDDNVNNSKDTTTKTLER